MNKLLEFITQVGNLTKCNLLKKIIYLLTNLIHFLPIFLYGINKITLAITIIGIISTLFHSFQCKCSTDNRSKYLLILDSIVGTIMTMFIVYNLCNKLNILWYVSLFLSIIIYVLGTNDKGLNLYLLLHSTWHILSGLLFLYSAYINNIDSVN